MLPPLRDGATVYLAGPMAGLPDHGYPAFHAATSYFKGWGLVVLSPAAGAPTEYQIDRAMRTEGASDFRQTRLYKRLMARGFQMIADSDAVILLSGWERSQGACAEVAFAHKYDIPCFKPGEVGLERVEIPAAGEWGVFEAWPI